MNPRVGAAIVFLAVPLLGMASAAPPQDKFHLKPGANGKLCLECHAEFQETVKLPFVHTPVKSGECSDCHNPHASSHGKLLAAGADAICSKCHARMVPEKARSVHDPVERGRCVQCHDPHASKFKDHLKASGNELCFGCHGEMAKHVAKIKFKHDPVEKGCLGCHDPHASANSEFLLKKEVPALCNGCHRTDQPVFAKQHMNYPVAKARCTSCHDPHGSDNGGLLWATVHPPLPNKMCNQCHLDPSSPNALATKKAGFELCRGCHSDLLNEISSKNRVHWVALDQAACLNCHSPHAAAQKALLRKPMKLLCGGCHADTIERQAKSLTKHPPVDEGDCAACHSPHTSNNVFLLKGPNVLELCGTCHDYKKHSNHPIGEKISDPRNGNLTLDCLSCHRTHGSPFKTFAHYDIEAELCVQCHEGMRR